MLKEELSSAIVVEANPAMKLAKVFGSTLVPWVSRKNAAPRNSLQVVPAGSNFLTRGCPRFRGLAL